MVDLILILICGGSATGWYQWTGRVRPFVRCKSCDGEGYKLASRRHAIPLTGRSVYLECSRCETTGKRLRWAARQRTRNDPAKLQALNGRR